MLADLGTRLTRLSPRTVDVIALFLGAASALAFAPFRISPLAIVLPALLYVLWLKGVPARAAWRGFLYGVGLFGVGTSWVYVSLHDYGNMPLLLAGLVVALFTAALAAFPALVGWLQGHYPGGRGALLHLVGVIPALWVLCEWLRGWILTGFPWLHLGYSQVPGPLAGFAPWLGVYGVSWAVAISAGLLVYILGAPTRRWRYAVPAIVVLWVAGWLAGSVEWTRPAGAPLRVALVQGDVPITLKWRAQYRSAILNHYLELSAKAGGANLIIWPEAAMPTYLDEIDPSYLERLRQRAHTNGSDFLIGVIERDRSRRAFYNSVVSIGATPGTYRKQHLVPLGEFLPLKSILGWLLDYLDIPMSDFSRGAADQPPLYAAGQRIAMTICYEDAFGEEVIRQLPAATLLINVSEDAWFGDSLASHQRLQMARMRALETGRPLLRVGNTGPSAIVGPRGEVTARSPQFQPFVLTGETQPMRGVTPYVRLGNASVINLTVLTLVLAWVYPKRWRRQLPA